MASLNHTELNALDAVEGACTYDTGEASSLALQMDLRDKGPEILLTESVESHSEWVQHLRALVRGGQQERGGQSSRPKGFKALRERVRRHTRQVDASAALVFSKAVAQGRPQDARQKMQSKRRMLLSRLVHGSASTIKKAVELEQVGAASSLGAEEAASTLSVEVGDKYLALHSLPMSQQGEMLLLLQARVTLAEAAAGGSQPPDGDAAGGLTAPSVALLCTVQLEKGFRMLTLRSCVELCNRTEWTVHVEGATELVLRPGSSLSLPIEQTIEGSKAAARALRMSPQSPGERYSWSECKQEEGTLLVLACLCEQDEDQVGSGRPWICFVKEETMHVPIVGERSVSAPSRCAGP